MIEHDPVEQILSRTKITNRELIIDFGSIPHTDPVQYAHGFFRGWCQDDILANGRSTKLGYSGAYLAGYKMGRRVATGREPMPLWASDGDATS